ncbi:MAG: hypothetical protein DLM69_00045 [Candidatus Chloroheliales bacterium]|nr:MAG: hypothetical protein DLM69_00045 [Chloroflexota bacterium]
MNRIRLPENVRREMWDYVSQAADKHRYLVKGRRDNERFIDGLVHDLQVGERLMEFMPAYRVKGYIRDAFLNTYSKERKALPRDVDEILSSAYGGEIYEAEYKKSDNVSMHRVNQGFIAVARASAKRWEIGVRKLTSFVAASPKLPPSDGTPFELVLIIFQHGETVADSEKRLTEKALKMINIRCLWGY